MTSPLGFKARVGCLIRIFGGEHNVHSPRSTSGATLANLLAAGMQPVLFPHTVAEVRAQIAVQTRTRALALISVSQKLIPTELNSGFDILVDRSFCINGISDHGEINGIIVQFFSHNKNSVNILKRTKSQNGPFSCY